MIPRGFDYRDPDYVAVFNQRLERLDRIRQTPSMLEDLKAFYRDNPADFIEDWGMTFNPKNVERGLPALVPFILYPRQREWVEWLMELWRNQKPGLTEKTRQMGFSWLSMAFSCTMCLFNPGMVIGVGSRKQEYVDLIGDPKSLIEKARIFMRHIPKDFRGSWDPRFNAPHMRVTFPDSGSLIAGESGDNIGRGATTSIYFVDEAAFLERPMLTEASLSQTTNCRQDVSTANGRANTFAQKRFGGKVSVFTYHWRHDPTKDEEWYKKQCEELDPVTVASELDIDYSASVVGILIPNAWVQSAVDAHVKLRVGPTGRRMAALDVADEGVDLNAFVGAYGILVEAVEEWSGVGSDPFYTAQKAFSLCDAHGYTELRYDGDGLGASVRGDARVINETRSVKIEVTPFRGSGAVEDPEGEDVPKRKNKDYFLNANVQSWWALRERFRKTHRWVVHDERCHPDEIISLSSHLPLLDKLMIEVSQATYAENGVGKMFINKTPNGARSPNLADALKIRFARVHRPLRINQTLLSRFPMRR